jgi:SRSO17 transposase
MSAKAKAPGTQEERFAAYTNSLAQAAGHLDRHEPLKAYCKGLLLPIERKSVEPMAARLAPDNVRQMHQSMHHVVADAPWSDEELLNEVRRSVLAAMLEQAPVEAWVIDDTGFPKKGKHSVGVGHQYCGRLGKSDNCQVAVSLSITTRYSSLPIAWRLYLPKDWATDRKRRKKAGVPKDVEFETKPEIALKQIQATVRQGVAPAPVLADAAYGSDSQFRKGITELGLEYVLGVQSSMSVWKPGEAPLPNKGAKKYGPDPLKGRNKEHHPVSAKEVALSIPESEWKIVTWREGTRNNLRSRFAAVRVRPAHRDYLLPEPYPVEWLLIEWPKNESEPTKYWLSTLPEETSLKGLVRIAKHRWIVERDYQELKQELGLGHYEGRGWRGFHHHATLCIAAYGFLVAERNRFSPSARVGNVGLRLPTFSETFIPRGRRTVTARTS